ncbi:MAG: pyrimidine dimer DNA glycosylase/endonuclease V [Hydrotalea sp.]|nr:pyrimidine dimer DNA glycosylase/endonuclease V [Hydrotalea sp.]
MTRINIIPPRYLTNRHLVAEFTELPRLAPYLQKTLRQKTPAVIKQNIVGSYILGKGHVYFWYDKIPFLQRRFAVLAKEMTRRGMTVDKESYDKNQRRFALLLRDKKLGKNFFVAYRPKPQEIKINAERIATRIKEKPLSYKDQAIFFAWYEKNGK